MVKKNKRTQISKVQYRTKEERQKEVRPIINKLTELQLTPIHYEPIKELFKKIQLYVNEGDKQNINIPFSEINKRIKGVLAINIKEQVWVKLENEKFK